ncbi:4Fe-4S binding protein [Bacteroidota bacterium]
MYISIASGKGGTGKTLIAAGIALSIKDSVYIDCDVEEPNGHIFLDPEIDRENYVLKKIPLINYELCNYCGKCSEVCEFNALLLLKDEILLFRELCHSCGACEYFCPQKAIDEVNIEVGTIRKGISRNKSGKFIEGRLLIGQMAATPVINAAKNEAEENKLNIFDAPPGTSCSMVETVRESDYCILVTEPTPFGLNDLKLAVNSLRIINVPFGVIINKHDGNYPNVEKYCKEEEINILLKIPFDKKIAEAYSKGKSIVNLFPKYKSIFKELINSIRELTEGNISERIEEAGNIKR